VSTGAWTFTLFKPLDHPDTNDTENDLTIEFGGLVQATDFDGDTVTSLGSVSVLVDDDTPVALTGTSTDSVDEDALVPNGIDGGPGDIGPGVDAVANGSVAGLFLSGADTPLTYGFNTAGAMPAGLTSGGIALTYAITANLITAEAGAGNTVFTMALNATTGAWTFTLLKPLDHPDTNDTENDLTIQFGGLVQATDKDGDTVTSLGTVSVLVDDDTPVALTGTSTDFVDEDALVPNGIDGGPGDIGPGVDAVANGSVAGLFQSGADVPLTYGFNTAGAMPAGLTSGGVALTYTITANLITAEAGAGNTVFTMALNASTGAWTFTLFKPLDHPDTNDTENDLTIEFGGLVQATDKDGDTVTSLASVSVLVDDDTPVALLTGTSTDFVDEDALANGIDGGPGDIALGADAVANGSVAGLFQSGADVPLTYGFNTAGAMPAGLTSGGVALTYTITANLITAEAGAGNTVFTMSLNATTGAWTFTLFKPLDHPDDNTNTENDLTIEFGGLVQATDKDGDTVTSLGTVSVLVDDDTPRAVISATSTDSVDEDKLPNGIEGGPGDIDGGAGTVDLIATGSVTGLFQSGADTPLTYGFNTGGSMPAGLTSGGVALTYIITANLITAEAGAGNTVFTMALNATTGAWTFTLVKPLDHPNDGTNTENDLTIQFGGLVQATDADGDTVTAVGTVSVVVDDDTPTTTNDTAALAEGGTATGNVLTNDAFGADGPNAIRIVGLTDADGTDGGADDYGTGTPNQPVGNIVTITGQFGILSMNVVTGEYTYNQTVAISANQTDVFTYTIQDADGDQQSATLTVSVTDNPPQILNGTLITNSNVTNQFITLSFTEIATSDFKDYLHAAAKIYDLNLQGQQGSIIQDVGFNINDNANYNVVAEASSGTKAIITDFALEGVTIQGSGNAQLEKDNTSSTSSDSTAITAIINPQDPIVQAKAESIDGDGNNNALTDSSPTTLTYYFGADGTDTLTGNSGADVLNGGGGADIVNGMAGNDIIVYDALDTINGGSNPLDSAANDAFIQEDWDILRIDDGALSLSLAGSSSNANTLGPGDNVTVNLVGKAISNIEIILITEEAGQSTTAVDPNDNVGTTLQITAADVFNYTDADHELFIVGSPGDVVNLGSAASWVDNDGVTPGVQGTTFAGSDGQMFTAYQSVGPNSAIVYIENEVAVQFNP
jgi:T1SS-143 domain-containing protein